MSKSKVASIRALQELKGIVEDRLRVAYSEKLADASRKTKTHKEAVCCAIRDEIEAYAVERYAKYGLKVVAVCHRTSSYRDEDIVRAELKIKVYPGIEEVEKEYDEVLKKEEAGKKKIEDWYFKAVQAVASQVDLPETPDFE